MQLEEILNDHSIVQRYFEFQLPKSKIKHWGSEEWTKDEKSIGHATDFKKASDSNFYNKIQIINQFKGCSRQSALLETKKSEVDIGVKEKKILIKAELIGARINGYNEEKISHKCDETIKEINRIEDQFTIETILISKNLINDKQLINSMISAINGDSRESIISELKKDNDYL